MWLQTVSFSLSCGAIVFKGPRSSLDFTIGQQLVIKELDMFEIDDSSIHCPSLHDAE